MAVDTIPVVLHLLPCLWAIIATFILATYRQAPALLVLDLGANIFVVVHLVFHLLECIFGQSLEDNEISAGTLLVALSFLLQRERSSQTNSIK